MVGRFPVVFEASLEHEFGNLARIVIANPQQALLREGLASLVLEVSVRRAAAFAVRSIIRVGTTFAVRKPVQRRSVRPVPQLRGGRIVAGVGPAGHGALGGIELVDPEGFKIGKYHLRVQPVPDPDRLDRECSPEDEADVREGIAAYFPEANGPTRRMVACMFTTSPDEHFILDRHPAVDDAFIAAGFSTLHRGEASGPRRHWVRVGGSCLCTVRIRAARQGIGVASRLKVIAPERQEGTGSGVRSESAVVGVASSSRFEHGGGAAVLGWAGPRKEAAVGNAGALKTLMLGRTSHRWLANPGLGIFRRP